MAGPGSVAPVAASAGRADDELTIDELAAEVGMTVRNIRAHQARGLVPAPRIVGRVGYYGPLHRRRLEQIQAMQDEGLNLAAIARVVNEGQLTAITTEVFDGAEPAYFEVGDLTTRLMVDVDDGSAQRAIDLGLLAVEGDKIRVDNPALLTIAEEFLRLGVPISAQLDALEAVQVATRQVADAYLQLADEHLIARVAVDSGLDPDELRAQIGRLRDAARAALVASFNRAMSAALREHFDPSA